MTASEARDISILSTYAFKPESDKQRQYYKQMMAPHAKIVYGHGASGTGKSIMAIKAALDLLSTGEVDRIMVMTEACEVGHKLGSLPGDADEKMRHYFESVLENLYEVTGDPKYVTELIEKNKIVFKAINFIRGATFRNAAVIFDEAQNTTKKGMKAFLTRVGKGSRLFINGDESQVDDDRLKHGNNGLADSINRLKGKSDAIMFTEFTKADILRDDIIVTILEAYED